MEFREEERGHHQLESNISINPEERSTKENESHENIVEEKTEGIEEFLQDTIEENNLKEEEEEIQKSFEEEREAEYDSVSLLLQKTCDKDFNESSAFDVASCLEEDKERKIGISNLDAIVGSEPTEVLIEKKIRKRSSNEPKRLKNESYKNIELVLQQVQMWRRDYEAWLKLTAEPQEQQSKVRLDLAAEKVGLPRKTLDDYFAQIKKAAHFKFDFESNLKKPIGVLRKFNKEHKAGLREIKVSQEVLRKSLGIYEFSPEPESLEPDTVLLEDETNKVNQNIEQDEIYHFEETYYKQREGLPEWCDPRNIDSFML